MVSKQVDSTDKSLMAQCGPNSILTAGLPQTYDGTTLSPGRFPARTKAPPTQNVCCSENNEWNFRTSLS
jgi:hypothetical protein